MSKSNYNVRPDIFSFLMPVLAVLLCSFSANSNENAGAIRNQAYDTIPAPATKSNADSGLLAVNTDTEKGLVQHSDSSRDSGSIEPSYPGGSKAWMHYLVREFRYPVKAQRENIQGKVILHFVVDEKGRISDIEALTGDPLLQKEAKRVVRNSGKWIPAYSNGKPIVSGKDQSITFKLESKENVEQVLNPLPPGSDSSNMIYTTVEVESSFPGGPMGWMKYLNGTFRYPVRAQQNFIQGTVVAQFIVDRDGTVSNIEAISGPESGGLREEVVRVIKGSGKWLPALKDGHPVKSYKKQPITFKLERN